MNYLVTIGLEIHTTVNTKRKMFSNAYNKYDAAPNSCVAFLDLGLPGTLPVINRDVINKAIQLGHFFNMHINYDRIVFDRKNYFYYDLPKGFQISQYYHPIATNGVVYLTKAQKAIKIIQIQIEEDTAKQSSSDGMLHLDYNRCGAPLLEIVSEPNFTHVDEVVEFLVYLKRSLIFNNISDGKMELGNLRVDLNISLRANATSPLGNKVEVKNINSFTNVVQAINYEIARQSAILDQNQIVPQETRRWDQELNATVFMRAKNNAVDYTFIPEANLPPYALSDDEFAELINNMPTSWLTIANELQTAGLTTKQIDHLLDDYDLYQVVAQLNHKIDNWLKAYKWIAIEILGVLNKANLKWQQLSQFQQDNLFDAIIGLEVDKIINGKQIKVVFSEIISNNLSLPEIIKLHQMEQISDLSVLCEIVSQILQDYTQQLEKFLTNEMKFEKFIIGQIMARTQAQANPNVAKQAYDQVAKPLLKN